MQKNTTHPTLTERELSIITRCASQHQTAFESFYSIQDARNDLILWALEPVNHKYVTQWRQEGKHGENKLSVALRRQLSKEINKQRLQSFPFQYGGVGTETTRQAIAEKFEEIESYKKRIARTENILRSYYVENLTVKQIKEKFNIVSKDNILKHIREFEIEYFAYDFNPQKGSWAV